MNEELIRRWNEVVTPDDIVYHLGDFSFGGFKKRDSMKKRLNGTIIIIRGNHDPGKHTLLKHGFIVSESPRVEIEDMVLSHKPIPNKELNGKVNVHGHIHTIIPKDRKHINACVEQTNYYPKPAEYYIKKVQELMDE